ncbi:LOW QUALITY PROTEIN: hypothetical protein HID58_023355 [Brassica napus]|uniref:Uncharacterized protein n=1 Tax=Brassica napus TaxID=3708 RepID=A0ABQ8D1W1_BRANA|nr:LOW QUALITY PROTEIN: hypothetical protein HID58_023355 [Brassica napus]
MLIPRFARSNRETLFSSSLRFCFTMILLSTSIDMMTSNLMTSSKSHDKEKTVAPRKNREDISEAKRPFKGGRMKQGGVIEQKSNMLRWIPPGSPGLGGVEVKNEKHMRQTCSAGAGTWRLTDHERGRKPCRTIWMQVTKCSTNCLTHNFTNNFIVLASHEEYLRFVQETMLEISVTYGDVLKQTSSHITTSSQLLEVNIYLFSSSSYKAADANDSITKFEYIFSCGLFDCVEESIGLFMYIQTA